MKNLRTGRIAPSRPAPTAPVGWWGCRNGDSGARRFRRHVRRMRTRLNWWSIGGRCAVKGYSANCSMTGGNDHRTYDPCLPVLHEEVGYES